MAGFLRFPEEALAEAHGLDGSLWLTRGECSRFLPQAGTGLRSKCQKQMNTCDQSCLTSEQHVDTYNG